MGNLPAVMDDFKNAKNLSRMMGIPDENIKELINATHKSITELLDWFILRIRVLTKILRNETTIKHPKFLSGGLLWEDILANPINLIAPLDFVIINLNENDKQELVKLKEL